MSSTGKTPTITSNTFEDLGVSSIPNPGSGKYKLINRSGKFYARDSSGTETQIGGSSGAVQTANQTLAIKAISTWTKKNTGNANNWNHIIWVPELSTFVGVSSSGTGNRVSTSHDGVVWIPRNSAVDNNWQSIAWSPSLGIFAAVSNSGSTDRVMTSYDSVHWKTRTTPTTNSFRSICWSSELGIFAAVASSGTGDRVITSSNGTTWISRTNSVDNDFTSITWSPDLLLFVAVASTGTTDRVMTSPDGITWTTRTSASNNNWTSVCWSKPLGLFVAVASSGTGNRVMTSADGISWTSRASAADNNWNQVIWSDEMSLFIAVAESGTSNRIMTSFDGISWTSRTSPADYNWSTIAYSPQLGIFSSLSRGGSRDNCMISNDIGYYADKKNVPKFMYRVARASDVQNTLNKWQVHSLAGDLSWQRIIWTPSLNRYTALNNNNAGAMISYSHDGYTWTARPTPADNVWRGLCWSQELSLMVSVSDSGTSRVMTSPDGFNWTLRTAASNIAWQNVCWGPEVGLFAAIANSATGADIMTSPDGITWTARTTSTTLTNSICYSSDLQMYVACGNTAMQYSYDGITWTNVAVGDRNWFSVVWCSELGLFVSHALFADGNGINIATSPNGIDWTTTGKSGIDVPRTLVYAPELGCIVAVNGTQYTYSLNAVDWYFGTVSSSSSTQNGLCWNPDHGYFLSVGIGAVGARFRMSNRSNLIREIMFQRSDRFGY